jgi:hypothetical protein
MKIIERIFNGETGLTEDIEREMTPSELSAHQRIVAEEAKLAEQIAELEQKKSITVAKLAALGLNEDDLKAIGLA